MEPASLALFEPDARNLAVTLSKTDQDLRAAESALAAARERVRELRKTRNDVIVQIVRAGEVRAQLALEFAAEADSQGRARCAGCRKRLRVGSDTASHDPRAWCEFPKPTGGTAYYCRDCSEIAYKTGSA